MKVSTVLKSLIFASFLASVAGLVTLRLSDDIIYGQPFALVCYTSTEPAVFATFHRAQKANEGSINDLSARLGTVSGTTCLPDSVNMSKYKCSCSSDGREISLIVPAENLMEHNTVWKCSNAEGTAILNNNIVTIFVNVPVSSLQLSPNGSVSIDEFETNTFTCTTSFCRPQATISWWKNNVNITNTADTPTYDQNFTTGSLKYTGNRLDNGHTIVCKASNGYGVEKTSQQSVELNIRYAPDGSPSIGNFSNGSIFSIIENMPQTFSCSITGGNPLASISWNCFGFVGSINTVEQTVTSNITLNVNRNRAGQPCQCLSIHELQGNVTATILVEILYPPVVTPFESPVRVVECSPLEVVCISDGNPIPDLTWSPQGEDTKNKSRLYYHNITKSNNGTHRCTANNTMKPTSGSPVNVSNAKDVVIDVLYPPKLLPLILPDKVVEGSPLEVVCRSEGNPIPDLTWSPQGEDTNNKSRLYYHNITKNNSGIHRCTANSTMRPTSGNMVNVSDVKEVVIHVLYGASITNFNAKDNNYTIMENDSLQLHCQVDSNPLSDIFLYYQDNNQLMKEDNALKLNYTKTAECLDAGNYTCRANNSIMNGYSASSDLEIMVACSPRFDHRKNVSTVYYTGLNSNVTLEVYVIAYPVPTNITWYHRGNETDMWLRVTYQPPVIGELFSSILIQLTSQRDFGYYMVTMGNYLGNFSNTYRIIPENAFEDKDEADVLPVGAIAGGISGAVVVVVLVILIVISLRHRGLWSKDKDDDFTRELRTMERPESGLNDNPVYDSSGPTVSSGAVGVEYAVVVKKTRVDDVSNLYAQVYKKNNKKKGGEKGKHGQIPRESIYENSNLDGQSRSNDKLYENSKAVNTKSAYGDNLNENPGALSSIGCLVSKDGLHYADLLLDSPTTKNGKPFIRGIEYRTEYAKIAYGKRGEPLSDSDKE